MESTSVVQFSVVLGLVFISAFFSGSETGLFSVTRAKIHKLKMEGNRRAIIVSKLREDKERLIGAILLGNNVVNIAASAIATALAIQYVGESGVIYATAVMTVLVLVFAEVLPKTYAVRYAEQVALTVAPVFILITKALSPITTAVQVVVDCVISLFSSPQDEQMSGVEVLRGAVDLYHEEGDVPKEDKDMLSGILDLGNTEIEEVMVHRSDMVSLSIDQPVEEMIQFVANSVHSRFPLWKEAPDNIIGIIHTKDLFKAVHNHTGPIETLDIQPFLQSPWFVPETTTLKNQLKAFQHHQKHIALVVDEFGSVTGLITLEDIVEEVVGEIEDEYDQPNEKRIYRLKNGSYNIDGDMPLREINRELDWSLPDEGATTLAGYVMVAAQCIPEVGDVFEINNCMFKILKKNRNQLTRIKVRLLDEEDSGKTEPTGTDSEEEEAS